MPMGFIPFPEYPPMLFESIGFLNSMSIFMAFTVLMATMASASAVSAACASVTMLVTFGESLTKTGMVTFCLTALVMVFIIVGSVPTSSPNCLACGQLRLSSSAAAL